MKVGLTPAARKLRARTTDAEIALWSALRSRQLDGFKFKRQVTQGPYIADFLCVEAKLIVEVDGGQHAQQRFEDDRRTRYFEGSGFRVLRFWNNEVLQNRDGVLETIAAALLRKSPLTQPSPRRERALGSDSTASAAGADRDGADGVPSPLRDIATGYDELAEAETGQDSADGVSSPISGRATLPEPSAEADGTGEYGGGGVPSSFREMVGSGVPSPLGERGRVRGSSEAGRARA